VTDFEVKALSSATWPPYEAMLARHGGGGFGGCWCTGFHELTPDNRTAQGAHVWKEQMVRQGKAHAALVFDGDDVIGWCQFGSPAELPRITHKKEVENETWQPPDYRIGCVMVDRRRRRQGVATAALEGALELIAAAGGGVVEAYPYDVAGRKVSGSFLYNATRDMLERAGFGYERPKGKNHCVMRREVAARQAT
jgi:ribosomal protein S18 acetylase RimI-like enzyme